LNAGRGGHPNSIAWLLWDIGREIDAQVADLTGREQVWYRSGFAKRLALGEASDDLGYGRTPQEAAAIKIDNAQTLIAYVEAITEALVTTSTA